MSPDIYDFLPHLLHAKEQSGVDDAMRPSLRLASDSSTIEAKTFVIGISTVPREKVDVFPFI